MSGGRESHTSFQIRYPGIIQVCPISSHSHPLILVPSGPRNPPEGFEDPPPGQLEPTWYRHEPPAKIRKAFEAQGYKWEDVLKELERRRDAMVEGNEWDVTLENGQIVWKKPSAETVSQQVRAVHDFRQWGSGWRSYVLWGIWRLMGSPEGVYETEDGKVDGKLVLRDLQKKRKDALVETKSEDGETKQ